MRIERRRIESARELTTLVTEVLEGQIKGFRLIDRVEFPGHEIEVGLLVGDAEGRLTIVAARERSGDSLILSYGRHVSWLKGRRDSLAKEHPGFDWDRQPGIIMMAGHFSADLLNVTAMLPTEPRVCLLIKCLGIGSEKGLYVEPVDLPEVGAVVPTARQDMDLLTRAVSGVASIAGDLSVSASFGYVSETLDWVPVANIRKRSGAVWVEAGPGKWTTVKVEDDASLGTAVQKVKASYDEVLKTKGEAKSPGDSELSDAERKSLRWE